MIIHYRPLANRRDYESIRLPLPDARRAVRQAAYLARQNDEIDEQWAARMDAGLVAMLRSPPSTQVVITSRVVTPRPDPLGDAVARNGLRALAKTPMLSPMDRVKDRAESRRARTTQEIPVAVDATLPAIAAALERLKASLGRNGTAAQLLAVEAIGLAVETVREEIDDAVECMCTHSPSAASKAYERARAVIRSPHG